MRKFNSIMEAWEETRYTESDWRRGQALFNVLYRADPLLAQELHNSEANPFYDDSKCRDAVHFIQTAYGV
jgi:hypothetical protein